MQTAISLPDTLFQKAEQLAKHLSLNRSQLYARALEAFITRYDTRAITAVLDEIYAKERSSVDQDLIEMQIQTLGDERW